MIGNKLFNENIGVTMMTAEEKIKIRNIVLTIYLKKPIDLLKLYADLKKEYDIAPPDAHCFPADKIKTDSFTLMVYASGKCVCAGISPDKDEILRDDNMLVFDPILSKVKSILKIEGEDLPEYKVQNIVSTTDLNTEINLLFLSINLQGSVYEPEVFPAIIYKKNYGDGRSVFLIYHNGKLVVHTPKFDSNDFGRVYKAVGELKKEIAGLSGT